MASYYTNITNTIVKISSSDMKSEDALLLNCHTDSVPGSPGEIKLLLLQPALNFFIGCYLQYTF